MASRRPLGRRILKNLGRKWVQVIISMLVFTLVLIGSYKVLVKPKPANEADKKKEEAEFKYLHCSVCNKEMSYNKDLADKPALGCACKPGDGGYWVATKESIKDGGDSDPSVRWFYTAVLIESILWMAALWYMLARKDATPRYYFVRCLHCREMLRYTASGFDKLVQCPSCEQPIRLPDEDEAMTEEDHHDETTEQTIGTYEHRLRATGYTFPHERLAEGEAPAGESPADQTAQPPPDGPR